MKESLEEDKQALSEQSASAQAATHYNTHYNTLQLLCNTLQLQHTTALCNTLWPRLQHITTHYNTLQHTTTHCNTLHHTATTTHCNTLQRTMAQASGDDVAALQAKVSVAEEACMELQAQLMAAEARGYASTALRVEFERVGFIVIVFPNLRHTATHCSTLQRTAPHCTTLQ